MHAIAIGEGLRERLQDDEAAAFAANVAIGPFVECVAAAGRDSIEAPEKARYGSGRAAVDAAGDRGSEVPVPNGSQA